MGRGNGSDSFSKAVPSRDSKDRSSSSKKKPNRYPKWKVDLFKQGMAERQYSDSGLGPGRATRAPGA